MKFGGNNETKTSGTPETPEVSAAAEAVSREFMTTFFWLSASEEPFYLIWIYAAEFYSMYTCKNSP